MDIRDWTNDYEYQRIQRDAAVGDQLETIRSRLVSTESICQRDVLAIEAVCPGLIMDSLPPGGYSIEPSSLNYEITLESIERYRALLVGGALVAILSFLWRIFGGGSGGDSSGGGSGGGGGRDYSQLPTYSSTADAGLVAAQQSATNIQHLATGTASLTAEFKANAAHHLALAGLKDHAIQKVLTDETTARMYICSDYLTDVQWHSLTSNLYGIVLDPNHATEQAAIAKLVEGMYDGIAERYAYIISTYEFLDVEIAKLRQGYHNNVSLPFPPDTCKDLNAVRTYLKVNQPMDPKTLSMALVHHISALKADRGVEEGKQKLGTYHEWESRTKSIIATCELADRYLTEVTAKRKEVSGYATSLNHELDALKDIISQWEAGRAPGSTDGNAARIKLISGLRTQYIADGNAVTLTSTHLLQAMASISTMGSNMIKAFKKSTDDINEAKVWLASIETRLRNATTN